MAASTHLLGYSRRRWLAGGALVAAVYMAFGLGAGWLPWPWFDATVAVSALAAGGSAVLAVAVFLQIRHAQEQVGVAQEQTKVAQEQARASLALLSIEQERSRPFVVVDDATWETLWTPIRNGTREEPAWTVTVRATLRNVGTVPAYHVFAFAVPGLTFEAGVPGVQMDSARFDEGAVAPQDVRPLTGEAAFSTEGKPEGLELVVLFTDVTSGRVWYSMTYEGRSDRFARPVEELLRGSSDALHPLSGDDLAPSQWNLSYRHQKAAPNVTECFKPLRIYLLGAGVPVDRRNRRIRPYPPEPAAPADPLSG